MNYYNEFDPKAAAWLRELIAEGHIPPGEVDTRSIIDVRPHELTPFIQHHFFAGIGGWSLALRLAGWPDDKPVRTGSCPCQPFSSAGKGLAEKDERHLWPVFRDLITFGGPTVTFGEQVASKLGREWLAGVRVDLKGLGYEVGAADLCAAGVGAPHIRQRLYWMANPCRERRTGKRVLLRQEKGRRIEGDVSQAARSSATRQLANTKSEGLPPRGDGTILAESSGCRRVGGLEHSPSDGREQRGAEPDRRSTASGCSLSGVGDPQGDGLQGRLATGQGADGHVPPGEAGYWDSFDLLPCRDGKARRVESGTFPLAHGISGRVGLLRGYGNAIVPQVAAVFIRSSVEALTQPA